MFDNLDLLAGFQGKNPLTLGGIVNQTLRQGPAFISRRRQRSGGQSLAIVDKTQGCIGSLDYLPDGCIASLGILADISLVGGVGKEFIRRLVRGKSGHTRNRGDKRRSLQTRLNCGG